MSTSSPAVQMMLGIFVSMVVGLGVWLVLAERKKAPMPAASVSPLGEEVKAQSFVKTKEEESNSSTEASPNTQNPASPKLTDA